MLFLGPPGPPPLPVRGGPSTGCTPLFSGQIVVSRFGTAQQIGQLYDKNGMLVGSLLYVPQERAYYVWPNDNLSLRDRTLAHYREGWIRIFDANEVKEMASSLGDDSFWSGILPWSDVRVVGVSPLAGPCQ